VPGGPHASRYGTGAGAVNERSRLDGFLRNCRNGPACAPPPRHAASEMVAFPSSPRTRSGAASGGGERRERERARGGEGARGAPERGFCRGALAVFVVVERKRRRLGETVPPDPERRRSMRETGENTPSHPRSESSRRRGAVLQLAVPSDEANKRSTAVLGVRPTNARIFPTAATRKKRYGGPVRGETNRRRELARERENEGERVASAVGRLETVKAIAGVGRRRRGW
jgi:hypothetical protein